MLRSLASHVRNQWAGFLSLFLVLTGGVAYAANEWTGENIVNGSLTSADYRNNNILSADVRDGTLADADLAPPEAWHEVAPSPPFMDECADPAATAIFCRFGQNFGSPWATAAFYKDQLGIVHLKGLIRTATGSGTSPETRRIFRLPVGYRPTTNRMFPSVGTGSHREVEVGRIDVAPDGLVWLVKDCEDDGGSIGVNCSATGSPDVTLDGITFRPDG